MDYKAKNYMGASATLDDIAKLENYWNNYDANFYER